MNIADLTPTSLLTSLEQLACAATEDACASALVSAAGLVQEAVLGGQSGDSFHGALSTCPQDLGMQMTAVLDRAVNFHLLASGGTLGLWLLPVVVNAGKALPSTIPLEARTMNGLKMSGCLLEQLGLSTAMAGGKRAGWTYILPALYSDEQIRNIDLGELIRLPHQARDVVRGARKAVSFDAGADRAGAAGVSLYYLPFVAFAPEGLPPTMPMGSAKTTTRMTQWATDTLQPMLADGFSVHVGHVPQPFSLALRVGQRLRTDVHLRELMQRVSAESGVAPNGLAALVAPYATKQTDGTFMVGVSLVSRLTKNVVATLSLPAESEGGEDEVAQVTHILKDMGMDCIQDFHAPITTIACQHCGNLQYALPNAQVAFDSMAKPSAENLH